MKAFLKPTPRKLIIFAILLIYVVSVLTYHVSHSMVRLNSPVPAEYYGTTKPTYVQTAMEYVGLLAFLMAVPGLFIVAVAVEVSTNTYVGLFVGGVFELVVLYLIACLISLVPWWRR